ncbi:MAG: hypothetical protein IV108_09140 [Burkholderiales bacterium]|nr:hypothetical protein [Burkholderiales bacterium]
MLKFLTTIGRKPIPPLTDALSITRWMEELPMGDAVETIEAVVKQIKEYCDQGLPTTKERLAVLTVLDQGAQDALETLRDQYLQNPRMSRMMESRLWNTVMLYYQEILRAYHGHLMEYIGNPTGSRIGLSIPLLTARAVNYFALDAIWSYYRYTEANPKLWKRLHNLYHFAEYEEFERQPLKLYEEGVDTSIAELYLQALMLETLNTGSLAPRQLYLIERWLPMLVKGIQIAREFKPTQHTFYLDLNENRGAHRVRRVEPQENLRYWDTYFLKEKLDNLRAQLTAGALPARLGLTEDCKLPTCLELLERIAYFWAPTGIKRVQRAFERKHIMQSIEVVRGLNDISLNVRADYARSARPATAADADDISYAEMVDVHLYGFVTQRTQVKLGQGRTEKIEHAVSHERWVMENESEGGYGANINDQADDWVRLGKLVGLKPEKKGHWNVGVIRRMRRISPHQQYVGIEVIAERPMALLLRAEKSENRPLSIDGIDSVGFVMPISALYFKAAQADQVDSLILQSAEYAKGRELWFNAKGFTYHIRLKQAVERGDDWLRASFDVLAKTAIKQSVR